MITVTKLDDKSVLLGIKLTDTVDIQKKLLNAEAEDLINKIKQAVKNKK